MNKTVVFPTSTYGLWRVTTEGDCEGRSVRDLGTYEGHIDDIAFKLASQAYYSLRFSVVNPSMRSMVPTGTKVQISLDIDTVTGTWDLHGKERAKAFAHWFKRNGREVTVGDGQYYACIELIDGADPEAIARKQQEAARHAALAKLTDADKKALGLE